MRMFVHTIARTLSLIQWQSGFPLCATYAEVRRALKYVIQLRVRVLLLMVLGISDVAFLVIGRSFVHYVVSLHGS